MAKKILAFSLTYWGIAALTGISRVTVSVHHIMVLGAQTVAKRYLYAGFT
jgi:hypothetical protein